MKATARPRPSSSSGNFRSQGRRVRPGSMGTATPGFDSALLDEELREVPDGHEGEIAVRVTPGAPPRPVPRILAEPRSNRRQIPGATGISPATAPSATRRAISGSSAAPTTSSKVPATASGPLKWKASCWSIPPCSKPRSWASPTRCAGRSSRPLSSCARDSPPATICGTNSSSTANTRAAPYKYPARNRICRRTPQNHQRQNPPLRTPRSIRGECQPARRSFSEGRGTARSARLTMLAGNSHHPFAPFWSAVAIPLRAGASPLSGATGCPQRPTPPGAAVGSSMVGRAVSSASAF